MNIASRLVVIALGGLLASEVRASSCQYAHVVDRCRQDLVVVEVGQGTEINAIDVGADIWGLYDVSGVDFSTVPGRERMSFIVQGPYVRVIDQASGHVVRNVDAGVLVDLLDLLFSKLDAAPPVEVLDASGQPQTQYALYLVGTRPGPEAYFVVLDQEAVLEGGPDALLGWGPLCPPGDSCAGRAVDVTVGSQGSTAFAQQAFVTAVDDEAGGGMRQVFYELTRQAEANGPWTVLRADEDDLPWNGFAHRSIGVDFEDRGPVAYGILQTGEQVIRLDDGRRLCDLPGQPTDIMVWGPASGIDQANYLFVTYRQGAEDYLTAFPADACPDDSLPSVATVPVGVTPLTLALSSTRSEIFWVYTANRDDGTLSTIRFRLWNDGTQDRLDVEEQGAIDLNGTESGDACPTHLAFEAGEDGDCDAKEPPKGGTSPPEPKCLDEDDPDCSRLGTRGKK